MGKRCLEGPRRMGWMTEELSSMSGAGERGGVPSRESRRVPLDLGGGRAGGGRPGGGPTCREILECVDLSVLTFLTIMIK